jgi:hypothetical protein
VSVSALVGARAERDLFPETDAQRRRAAALEEVTARIADRYDDEWAVTRASLLGKTRQ